MKFEVVTRDNSWEFKQCFMEALGTFGLCYVGGWACMLSDMGQTNLVGVALAHTFVLGFMIWAGGNISGGHYNGAVTLGLFTSGHITIIKALWYWLSQVVGSLLAGVCLALFKASYTYDKTVFASGLGFPHANTKRYGTAACFFAEFFATFFLVFMVYATAVARTKPNDVHGLAIGGCLGMAILSIGPMTGAALNPWRVFGPAVISGELFSHKYWYSFIYLVGCPLAGFVCALVWKVVFMRVNDEEEPAEVPVTGVKKPLLSTNNATGANTDNL